MATDSTDAGSVPSLSGDMILLVEDPEGASPMESLALEEEGFSVACAGSGEEALEMMSNAPHSLVLLDILLPLMDGFTTCQKIRESSQVPIIMVTPEGRDEDKVRGLEMGADDYITRPFTAEELAARVKAVLRRTSASRAKALLVRPRASEPDMSFLDGYAGLKGPVAGAAGPSGEEMRPARVNGVVRSVGSANDENYEGGVKLVVETKGTIKDMVEFVDTLRGNPQFHLLRMVSNARRDGMDVWLRLRQPIPLRATLLSAAGVSKVETMGPTESEPGTPVFKVSLA